MIMLLRLYLSVCFCFLLVMSFGENLKSNERFYELRKIHEELPKYTDLIQYLDVLNRIVNFCGEHRNDIDINFYFGLFLANVALKRVYFDKYQYLPEKLNVYLAEIIRKIEKLLDFYVYMVKQDNDERNNKFKTIFKLFANSTKWLSRISQFHLNNLNEIDEENFDTKWSLHVKNIDNISAGVPNPHQSDLCLVSLASAKKIHEGTSRRCEVIKLCYEMLKNGTDFGYALTHRILFLQQAKYGRGCSIFSEKDDELMVGRFCSIAYRESEYIARHHFAIVDLVLEHVCLCALDGHAIFFQRSWLTSILRFQTQYGCFTQNIHGRKSAVLPNSVWKLAKTRDQDIMGGHCNGHTTALAAGTLAMASRFLIEFYFL